MAKLLPIVTSEHELLEIHRDPTPWIAAATAAVRQHGLNASTWTRAGDGSQIVMLGGDVIVKFYVPFWPSPIEVEAEAMELLAGRLDVETPQVLARGALEGWDYLIMDRLQGTALRDVAPELSRSESLQVAESIGTLLRQLHQIEVPEAARLRQVVSDWGAFLTSQWEQRAELEEARKTPPEWIARLIEHLSDWRYEERPTATFIHADLTHDHLLLSRSASGRWRLSGLIDFGDAKTGDAAYDFAALFGFWTSRRPDLRRAMLEHYGDTSDRFQSRIFESLLLHEFGRLALFDLTGLSNIADIEHRYVAIG